MLEEQQRQQQQGEQKATEWRELEEANLIYRVMCFECGEIGVYYTKEGCLYACDVHQIKNPDHLITPQRSKDAKQDQ